MESLKKERNTLESTALKLLSIATKEGASLAEVCGSFTQKTRISMEKQDYHLVSSDNGFEFGIRVITNHQQGFASCNSINPNEIKEVATRAIQIAKLSPENPYYDIAPSSNVGKEGQVELWNDQLFHTSLQTQKEWAKILFEESTKDPLFRLNEGSIELSSRFFLVANSKGTHKLERETAVNWSLMGMAVEGENITPFDYFQEMSRNSTSVADQIQKTSRSFRERIIRDLRNGPGKSYMGLVLLSPRAIIDILLPSVSYHLNGRNIVEKTGRWNLDHLGKSVLNSAFILKDQPLLSERRGCCTFDREGTPTENRMLIYNGAIKGFLLDQYAATALKHKTTGNAIGSPSTIPAVASHCLCISGGNSALRELVDLTHKNQNDFLEVHRFSGQSDPVTGDFSGVAKSGQWWHSGERIYSVRETLIAGNVFDSLGKHLRGVSRETEIVETSEESPTMLIDGISVTCS